MNDLAKELVGANGIFFGKFYTRRNSFVSSCWYICVYINGGCLKTTVRSWKNIFLYPDEERGSICIHIHVGSKSKSKML